ncbi:MAG: exodeoxyribonuclease III [Puniceicoccales bacterium]|jgi:exodeoxyribonuclease-3|nr:exodeoxyribonuclease III [Puniceicoccales bacterium]
MKIVSWNVNGLRAILNKNFATDIQRLDPDILCLQEIKAKPSQLPPDSEFLPSLPFKYFHAAERLGYSGTAIFSKTPCKVLEAENFATNVANTQSLLFPDSMIEPQEGRVQVVDCGAFWLVNVYTPNANGGGELKRLSFRHEFWDPKFCEFLKALEYSKPIVTCGDFNVAHREIDLAHPEQNHRSAGFTDEERKGFSRYIGCDFVDIFRQFYPNKPNCYTWWSYRMSARQRNIGWRIDYFLISKLLAPAIKSIEIYADIMGSDHAPMGIEL